MKRLTTLWIVGIIMIVGVAVLPWLLQNAFAPLRPLVFEVTATVYWVTESAYLTREAQIEMSATSEMIILTPEDEILPGDPDYMLPTLSSGLSETHLTNFVVTPPSVIIGTASQPLERYTCPSPSAHISGPYPPNQIFKVLGWNVDLDDVPYLLIQDNPIDPQEWLRIPDWALVNLTGNYLDTPTITCRTYVITPAPPSDITPGSVLDGTLITATFTPPPIATVQPTPMSIHLEITEQDAIQQIAESVPELQDPQIEITPEGLEIRGYLNLPGPLGTTIRGDVVILAALVQEGSKLRAELKSVTVAGRDITETDDGQIVENAINNWFNHLLVSRDLETFQLLDGLLIIDGMQRESILPTLVEQTEEAATPSPTLDGTPTITLTFIVSTATATVSRTPLPVWTQTPSPTGQVKPTLRSHTATPVPGG